MKTLKELWFKKTQSFSVNWSQNSTLKKKKNQNLQEEIRNLKYTGLHKSLIMNTSLLAFKNIKYNPKHLKLIQYLIK